MNRWIRASRDTVFDGVADLAHALGDPTAQATLLPACDSGDHIHPDDAGAEFMADVVYQALFP